MLEYALGMDMGTSSVVLYREGRGIVLQEPSVVAARRSNGQVICAGTAAQRMLGRTPEGLAAVHPLRGGVISDCGMAGQMIQDFVRRSGKRRFSRPDLLVCVPPLISELEERAVIDTGLQAGASRVFLLEEPMAAAVGAGMNPAEARGSLLVDIGAGTTDIAILSFGAVVHAVSIHTAGNEMDAAIVQYMKQEHQLDIGEVTAEQMKNRIGAVCPREEPLEITVYGRSSGTGLPRCVTVTDDELTKPLGRCVDKIMQAVCAVIAEAPPELVGDLAESGVLLTGGVSQLYGLEQRSAQMLGLQAHFADDPLTCVARGTAHWLGRLNTMPEGTINLARRRAHIGG